MLIRRLEPADLDRVSELEADNFTMPWSREAFEDMMNNPTALYMVAVKDKKIVGNCGIITAVGEGDICNVVTDREYRGRGIAYELVKTVMAEAAQTLGVTEYTLEVRVSNEAAIHLYEKLGFKCEGIRPRFYEKPVEDAMIMWKRSEA